MSYSSIPIDIITNSSKWTGSFRYEKFLQKWFYVQPDFAGKLFLFDTNNIPNVVLDKAKKDNTVWKQSSYAAPVKIQIQLNAHCNYQCKMCYASSLRGKALSTDFKLDQLKELFAYLKNWGVLRVNFVGGEIFMRNDIKDIVQAAYDERLLVSCITNARIPGTNIKKYKDLLQSMFNVQISCNGIGKSYEEEYGTNNWMQASKCIRNVIKATKRNILSFVITEKNFLDIPKFFEFAKSIKPNIIKFGSKCWSGRSVNKKKLDYYRVILPKSKQFIEEGRKKYPQLNIQSQIDLGEETPLWEEYLHGYRPFEFYFAPEGRDGVYIKSNGDIYPFPLLSDRDDFKLGNVYTENLKEIWQKNTILQKIRAVTFKNSECGKVGCKKVCGLWSRSYAIAWSNKLDGKVPCEYTNWQ